MDPRELEEYPICNICHAQIDLQEGPYCENCRAAMKEEDWEVDFDDKLLVFEFDTATITRKMLHERVGRVISNEEWERFTSKLDAQIYDAMWDLIENAIEKFKEEINDSGNA